MSTSSGFITWADGDGTGGLPAKRPENGLRAALPLVGAFADLDDGIIRLIPLQETVVIGGLSDAGAEGIIGITVAGQIHTVGPVGVHHGKQPLHLTEAAHAAHMRILHREIQRPSHVDQFLYRAENVRRVVPDVGSDEFAGLPAAAGRLHHLIHGDAGYIADAEGDAEAARLQRLLCQSGETAERIGGDRSIFVQVSGLLPEKGVPSQQPHVDGPAVPGP